MSTEDEMEQSTYEADFELLVAASRQTNAKARDLAEVALLTGTVPEHATATLDCGCLFMPGRVTIGYGPHPQGGSARTYYCRTCRQTSYAEPDDGRGPVAIGR